MELDMVQGLERAGSARVKSKTTLVSLLCPGHSLGCQEVKPHLHQAEEPTLPLVFKSQSWGCPTVKTNQAVTFNSDSNNNLAMSTFSEVSQLVFLLLLQEMCLVLLTEKRKN